MLRVGILSDTHLSRVSEDLRRTLSTVLRGSDMLIHAGDITSIEVHDYLAGWNLVAVRGNMDDFEVRSLLPDKRIEEIEGKRIGIMHGRGGPYGLEDLVRGEFADVDLIVFGHSHIPLHTIKEGTILFNPGSFRGGRGYSGTVGLLEIGETMKLTHLGTV